MHGAENNKRRVIVGLGSSGLSCARYLHAQGLPFAVLDSRAEPPGLGALRELDDGVEVVTGTLDSPLLLDAEEIILSPGVDPALPVLVAAVAGGARLFGDIEMFFHAASAPVVAITGSNAKSTVTTLLGKMAEAAGIQVAVGGNLGRPALDLVAGDVELYVLELSSFQLDTVIDFRADVAAFLNFCPDHLDRYPSLEAYRQSKQRIFWQAGTIICNRDEPATCPAVVAQTRVCSFGMDAPADGEFGLRQQANADWFARGTDRLMPVSELCLPGRHNQANALAALALGQAIGLPQESMCRALREFTGLPHRCQTLGEIAGVRYIDDSKATNVGAALASLQGLAEPRGRVVLIAGGLAKEDDFTALREPLLRSGRAVVLIGRAADAIARALQGTVPLQRSDDMQSAVRNAQGLAEPGDIVLLAPACASFDMFDNFAARGEAFGEAVSSLAQEADDA